jgi:hypothetical protein
LASTRAFHEATLIQLSMKNLLTTLTIVLALFKASPSVATERIWLRAKINGKPASLFFDSGANASAICPQTMQRLGLKFIPAPTNDFSPGVLAGDTEYCTLTLDEAEGKTSFLVLNLPQYVSPDFDGLIGWQSVSPNVLRIDAVTREVKFLPKVPTQSAHWPRFCLLTKLDTLDLQIPSASRTDGVLCVDTGFDCGLALPREEWRRWKEAHPQTPLTLETTYIPTDGFLVYEEAWADQIAIGPIVLTGVPVGEGGPGNSTRWGARYEGTLGLAALKRVDLIVDGKNGLVYVRSKTTRPPAYPHNRLGAIFLPTGTHTNQAVAWVIKGGPAYEAGVRDGDILLQVDELKVRSSNGSWLGRFSLPAGTKLNLTLERDGNTFKTAAILREIVHPSANRRSRPAN